MRYVLELTGVSIIADVPFALHSNKSTSGFFRPAEDGDNADLRLEFVACDCLPDVREVRRREGRRLYVGEGESAGTFFRAHPELQPYAFVSRHTMKDGYLCCEYLPGNEKYMDYTRNLLSLMDLEAMLLHFGALILHASLIRWKDMCIAFCAPSGTGKSTQATLWEKYEGAEIINGDRTAIRQIGNVWTAFGLPYAGTSDIFRNESAPIRAIVAIRQAEENRLRRISGTEAFRYLYPEALIHRWDPQFEEKASGLLLNIISETPVYLLECRPDREAVTLLRDTLEMTNH